jgi:formamidopyrimidine-DNA glycosylase
MPELPEVETVKNVLKPIVINKTIKSIDVLRSTIIQNKPIQSFVDGLIASVNLES